MQRDFLKELSNRASIRWIQAYYHAVCENRKVVLLC